MDRLLETEPARDFAGAACPFCDSLACRVVGATGIGKQVSILRCGECQHEWQEVLMFRYRRGRAPADPSAGRTRRSA